MIVGQGVPGYDYHAIGAIRQRLRFGTVNAAGKSPVGVCGGGVIGSEGDVDLSQTLFDSSFRERERGVQARDCVTSRCWELTSVIYPATEIPSIRAMQRTITSTPPRSFCRVLLWICISLLFVAKHHLGGLDVFRVQRFPDNFPGAFPRHVDQLGDAQIDSPRHVGCREKHIGPVGMRRALVQ